PTAAGDFTFTVQVRDGARASSKQLTIAVRNRVAITTPRVPRAEVGVELKPLKLVATGGTGTYAWKLESGSAPGLSFDPATAELTGTPTTAGSFPLKVSATDGDSRTATVDVTVRVSAELTILTESLRPGRVGRLYSATLASYGGVGPLKWKVVEGRFPVGIRLNRSTGAVFG